MKQTSVESTELSEFYENDRKRFPRVAASFVGDEQVLVHFRMQDLLVDHPPEVGGTGAGPSPGELLLAALAACTSVYVGRNAKRYDVPVESVHVGVAFETAREATDGPLDAVSYLPRIIKRVEVRGPLTEGHLAMVRFWVEHCAIGETLRRGVDLVEEVELVSSRDRVPLGFGDGPAGDEHPAPAGGAECCTGNACEIPI